MGDDLVSGSKRVNPAARTSDAPRRRRRVTKVDQLCSEVASCRAHLSVLQQEIEEIKRELGAMKSPTVAKIPIEAGIAGSEHFRADGVALPSNQQHSPRAPELRWLEEHYDELAKKYRGKAIVIFADRVVAADRDLEAVVQQAREAGFVDALFTSIPESDTQHRV